MTNKEKKKLEEKWEAILKKHGLGIVQPMTDHSDGDLAEVPEFKIKHPGKGKLDGLVKLRQKLDGGDTFMEGHQITKVRSMEREIPEWTLNNKEVQNILLTSFPNLKTNPRQAARAGRWARIICLYWRMKLPEQIVAREMKMSDSAFKSIIRNINRAARGFNVRGEPRRHPSNTPVREPERKDDKSMQGPPLHIARNDRTRANGPTS